MALFPIPGPGGADGLAPGDAIAAAKMRAQMNVLTGTIAKLVGEVEGLKSSKNVDAALAGGAAAAGGPGAAALAAANAATGAMGGALGDYSFHFFLGFHFNNTTYTNYTIIKQK